MSEFLIIPDFKKKTARFSGAAIAAGEHVAVRVVGAGEIDTTTLRLRVVFINKPLAEFPLAVEGNSADEWIVDGEDLTATLNLNTVQMLKFCRGIPEREALFILDDAESHKLYFASLCAIRGWPLKNGEDAPVNLNGYADLMAEFKVRLESAEAGIAANADAISAEETTRAATDTSQASELAAMSETLADKANAADLAAEAESREAKDAEHDAADSDLAERIANVGEQVEQVADALDAHANDTSVHMSAEEKAAIAAIESKIPSEASSSNKLADKAFVAAALNALKNGRFENVTTLPESGEEMVIYLVPRNEEEEGNSLDEYIWANGAWEKIGSTDIDLSGYVTKRNDTVDLTKEDEVYALLADMARHMGYTVVEE